MTGRGLALALALAVAWGGAGYLAGDHNRNNAWLAKQATQERLAREALQAEVVRGQAAATKAIKSQQALQQSYATLETQFNELILRGPLVVFGAVDAAGGAGQQRVGPLAGEGPDPAATRPGSDSNGGGSGLVLSFGAVWVWNSALAGADFAAGACGAADTTGQACASASGIPLEAAWVNHVANAKACASDRLRHQHLIDYLTAAQGTAP